MNRSSTLGSGCEGRVCLPQPWLLFLALILALLYCAHSAFAQHPGGGPPGGGQQGGPGGSQQGGMGGAQGPFGRPGGLPNPNGGPPPGHGDNGGATTSTMRGGLQLGPPGRWWNDEGFAKSLGLNRDQQHRMDEIFKANKGDLVKLFKGLKQQESQLDKVSRSKVLDEALIDGQIDKVVQARGELEKADAHMLLEIRKQMTPGQIAKLDEFRPPPSPSDN